MTSDPLEIFPSENLEGSAGLRTFALPGSAKNVAKIGSIFETCKFFQKLFFFEAPPGLCEYRNFFSDEDFFLWIVLNLSVKSNRRIADFIFIEIFMLVVGLFRCISVVRGCFLRYSCLSRWLYSTDKHQSTPS